MQQLSQKLIEFFIITLEYLGPFDYSLKEEYFLQNPSFCEFLHSVLEVNTTYVGQWKNGQKTGKVNKYVGYWFHNMAHCKGQLNSFSPYMPDIGLLIKHIGTG